MDSLPSEIICDIFVRSLPERQSAPIPKANSSPLYVSHVCRRWRTLSLSCGDLWSYFQFRIAESPSLERLTRIIEVFDTFIERSNASPLNFTIDCSLGFSSLDEDSQNAVDYVITTLVSQQWRWKDVELTWNSPTPSSTLREVNMTNMPMLTSLSLLFYAKSKEIGPIYPVVDLARSSRLHRISLDGHYILSLGKEPIHTLATCSALLPDGVTQDGSIRSSLLDLLRAAPELKQLQFRFRNDLDSINQSQIESGPPHVFHSLQFLILSGDSSTPIRSVTLPALETLLYTCHGPEGDSFLPFVRRSMPPLTYLELTGKTGNEDILIPALRLLPALQRLSVAFARITAQFYLALTLESGVDADRSAPDGTGEIVCPRLVSLGLYLLNFGDDIDGCADCLCSMLLSRLTVLNSFTKVVIDEKHVHDVSTIFDHRDELRSCIFFGKDIRAEGDDVPTFPSDVNSFCTKGVEH